MERSTWLTEKRHISEVRYDTLHASSYDQNWSHINVSHRSFLQRLLGLCPPGCTILDVACGTGKYWSLILESGRSVVGVDQSQQMLLQARAKFPRVRTEKQGLQEIDFTDAFDGVICVDAMEFVSPEDWPFVLNNFHRALKSNGYLYLTVELIDAAERTHAYDEGKKQGLPVVEGEYAHEGYYHYYPELAQVRTWMSQASFSVIEEGDGDGYYHLLSRRV
ncbi:MAG TPA: class I SAM-dependent methyltransferase [Ktedonobacteraceae bacterium]|jgi:cyclopropane fatty-acyl-phospholipid synthase-like methyltransferase|nr:class I SAM-dependent methyltransferase [Ktedonobacteraceae bacterium]